jgi:hypothetical protein
MTPVYIWFCLVTFALRVTKRWTEESEDWSILNIFQRSCCSQSSCLTQIGFEVLVATSTAKRVAVLRTLPAIVISASVMGLCCSASPSRRMLMSWS